MAQLNLDMRLGSRPWVGGVGRLMKMTGVRTLGVDEGSRWWGGRQVSSEVRRGHGQAGIER